MIATEHRRFLASHLPDLEPFISVESSNAPATAPPQRVRLALLLAVVAIGAVRLWFCTQVPENTADLLRSIHTALYVLRDGPAVVGVPLLELDPGLAGVGWAGTSYSYPPLALPFFVAIAALSPTLFAAKLALTIVEAANAVLVARISGSRWLGVAYWASPISIWWVSGEGQFEPWMALFMFGAVALLRTRPVLALVLLGLGVNVKLTAVLLLPWCAMTLWRENRAALRGGGAAFMAAVVLPVAAAGAFYPVIEGLFGITSTLRYNPYYWNVFDAQIFMWNPDWLRWANAVSSTALLAFLAYQVVRMPSRWPEYSGAIAFMMFLKVSSLAQFWYLALLPAFVMPIERSEEGVDVRWWLVLLVPFVDVRSLVQLLLGPFGWSESALYVGLSAFTSFGIR